MSSAQYVCDNCKRRFESENSLAVHQRVSDPEKMRQKTEVKKLIRKPQAPHHVYVVEIERQVGRKPFYYVGESKNVVERLMQHMSDQHEMSLPTASGGVRPQSYYLVSLISTHPFESKSVARNEERKIMLNTAMENDTTEVVGGK